MMVSNRNLLFQGLIFRFHVELQGCTFINESNLLLGHCLHLFTILFLRKPHFYVFGGSQFCQLVDLARVFFLDLKPRTRSGYVCLKRNDFPQRRGRKGEHFRARRSWCLCGPSLWDIPWWYPKCRRLVREFGAPWMFGETSISHAKIWNHPIETTIYPVFWRYPVSCVCMDVFFAGKVFRDGDVVDLFHEARLSPKIPCIWAMLPRIQGPNTPTQAVEKESPMSNVAGHPVSWTSMDFMNLHGSHPNISVGLENAVIVVNTPAV